MAGDGRPVPLYTVGAIEFLDQHVMKQATVLEFGSGCASDGKPGVDRHWLRVVYMARGRSGSTFSWNVTATTTQLTATVVARQAVDAVLCRPGEAGGRAGEQSGMGCQSQGQYEGGHQQRRSHRCVTGQAGPDLEKRLRMVRPQRQCDMSHVWSKCGCLANERKYGRLNSNCVLSDG